MKTYKFKVESEWEGSGCDCCEDIELVYYNPVGFGTNGTPSSEEDCYIACIEVEDPDVDTEILWDMELDELRHLGKNKYKFTIELEE